MSLPSPEELQQLTPMVRQFFELKARVSDAILFFRMGDFYEIFGDDAEDVAPVLDLVLTSRERGDKTRLPFCGVPHHSARAYWLKLLKLGYRVAIADQVEDPAEAKGLVRRDIVQVMTPGCIDDLEGLDADQPNHLVALYEVPSSRAWVLAALETSTGDFRLGTIERGELLAWVERLAPKEIVLRRFMQEDVQDLLKSYLGHQQTSFGILPEAILRDDEGQKQLLRTHFATETLQTLPAGDMAGGQELVAAILTYLHGLHAGTKQFLSIKPLHQSDRMLLDETVRRDLELFETVRRREVEGSLFKEINATKTALGARLLRHDLAHPFLDARVIRERQDAVNFLVEHHAELLQEVPGLLRNCSDLDRLTTRVLAQKAHPADLLMIKRSLEACLDLHGQLAKVKNLMPVLWRNLHSKLEGARVPLHVLEHTLSDEPATLGSLRILKNGFDPEFDRLRQLSEHGQEQIDAYEQKLKQETGISSLKIKEHKSYGLLIEITKTNLSKVPADFVRRQTMVNNERFITMELEELGQTLANATEQAVRRESELFIAILGKLGQHQESLRDLAAAIALTDVLQSFASKAQKDRYVRPELAQDGELLLKACRHPVVERWVGQHTFMPNDVHLTPQQKQLLITGPNMAGKSTVMRQTALAALLHQIGSYVPASQAKMPIFDRIFTRVGAADDLSRGQSTFMVEMAEAASILRQASERSLVILDEVGRGTSTQDGLAIAAAILDYMGRHLRAYTLFATHYHELVPFSAGIRSVKVGQVEVLEEGQKIRFTHRLVEGASGSSFGVEVAKLAGIPAPVIAQARRFMQEPELLGATAERKPSKKPVQALVEPPLEQRFREATPTAIGPSHHALQIILERLERVNVLKTSPMQALAILDEMKGYLERNRQGALFPEESPLC